MRCEAAKSAAIFIFVEWLFWWLFDKSVPEDSFPVPKRGLLSSTSIR
jgi:hypothetical protein